MARGKNSGITPTAAEVPIIVGMVSRGDRRHDIAAWFGFLERSRRPISGTSSWSQGDRVDQVISHDIAILGRLDNAAAASAMIQDTAPAIGMLGQRVLELALVDELPLAEVAQRIRGRAGQNDVIFFSNLFRESCEALADHWSRRDKRTPRG